MDLNPMIFSKALFLSDPAHTVQVTSLGWEVVTELSFSVILKLNRMTIARGVFIQTVAFNACSLCTYQT